ncbi:MAG: Crp/Fnr family transcriptional regulator [Clostridiales bacterium]|nr:Crp/Fnr family transcriptional regulator [Clostridiales bacterium]
MKLSSILKEIDLFSVLSPELLQEAGATARVRASKKDNVIISQGDICDSLIVILKGEVALEILTSSGDSVMVDLLSQYSCLGEELLFEKERRYPYSVVSCSNCEVALISKSVIFNLISNEPLFSQAYFAQLSSHLSRKNQHIAILSQKSLRQKVGRYLLSLDSSPEQKSFLLPASRETIAKYLAMPRPSFSRELARLASDGILKTEGREVTVLDFKKLEEVVLDGPKDDLKTET